MRVHELKTWPEPYAATVSGAKTFEIRKDDRGFRVNDILRLREWVPCDECQGGTVALRGRCAKCDGAGSLETYTGRKFDVEVTHVERGPSWGLPRGLVVMSVRPCMPSLAGAPTSSFRMGDRVRLNGEPVRLPHRWQGLTFRGRVGTVALVGVGPVEGFALVRLDRVTRDEEPLVVEMRVSDLERAAPQASLFPGSERSPLAGGDPS